MNLPIVENDKMTDDISHASDASDTPIREPDPRWIAIGPSMVNLALTLLAGVVSLVVMVWIDVPEWVKIPALIAIPLVLSWEAWHILQKNRGAVTSFYLEPIEVERTAPDAAAAEVVPDASSKALQNAAQPKLSLHLSLRSGTQLKGIVLPQSFVSFYFVSILYRLDTDPSWRRWFPRALALWPDSVDRTRAREVRVQLKWR